jgi:hypothetical protein
MDDKSVLPDYDPDLKTAGKTVQQDLNGQGSRITRIITSPMHFDQDSDRLRAISFRIVI